MLSLETVVILLLIACNGFFALAEIAIVSCKKSSLLNEIEKGNKKARIVLNLLEEPERFLSAIQVGITLIGIVAGAYGGVALAGDTAPFIARIAVLQPYAEQLALVLIIACITFFSIVFGELVPKTVALSNPERIAFVLAPFIALFAKIVSPAVVMLSATTRLFLKGMRIRVQAEQIMSEEELLIMIKLAGKQGILQQEEMQFHKNLLFLSDKKASHLMTNRTEVEMLDIAWPQDRIAEIISNSVRSCFPVYEGSIDNILGLLRARDFFAGFCRSSLDVRELLIEPVFLPETVSPLQILKIFKSRQNYFGIVVNEHGSFEGVLTLHDLIEHILGNLPDTLAETRHIAVREDGSLLVDGITPMPEVLDALELDRFDEKSDSYTTISGFVFEHIKSIPVEGFSFSAGDYIFEIVDMDGPRIDKILIRKKSNQQEG